MAFGMKEGVVVFEDLSTACAERQKAWGGASEIDMSFRGLELGGEVGELQNLLKKLIRLRSSITGTKETEQELLDAIRDELADVVICTQLVAGDLDIDIEKEVPKKFNKTSLKHGIPIMMKED